MKNKLPEDSIFRKKSFYVALYSCVGVVLILAAVVSYVNINQSKPKVNQSTDISGQLDDTSVNETSPNPRITTSVDEQLIAQAQADAAKRASESQNNADTAMARAARPSVTVTPAPKPSVTAPPSPSAAIEPDKADAKDEALADPVFNSYKDGDIMEWPVLGDIVMDYNVTQAIYDETLDQYRTNDNIWISAKEGSPVKAAFDGAVLKVEKTPRDGNTVVIDNGDGWTTTYGQLMDSVIVKEGEIVKRGQIIGGVAEPTKYSVMQGSNVSFKVAKDGVTVDPKTILKDVTGEAAAEAAAGN
ncbi:MAG: peptidoglycan DD-metalloendopeptidase family protein [Clostridiales bacterium]|jgi:murein DD-endopeptidase MepM/ murein hydrolase activator NlpD|nr:peptidoglycan DD-metalloendopeptidase family protein [Clostridiales bacterium]